MTLIDRIGIVGRRATRLAEHQAHLPRGRADWFRVSRLIVACNLEIVRLLDLYAGRTGHG